MNEEPAQLLIDNSNTRTKFALARAGEVSGEVRTMATRDIGMRDAAELLRGWNFEEVALCSVVPRTANILRAQLAGHPVHCVNQRDCPRLVRLYECPECIGADRLANAAALAACYELPALAVDLGTACTFDAVALLDGEPALLGGVIAPGIQSLAAAPSFSTALLPELRPDDFTAHPKLFARNTHDALLAGVTVGFEGMVRHIIESMKTELSGNVKVVATGGDTSLAGQKPTWADVVDPLLTLKGIAVLSGKGVRQE